MPTTPEWSIPWPLISAQADVPADMQSLAEATDAALTKATTQVVQSGVTTVTVPANENGEAVLVTFPTPFSSAPVVVTCVYPTSDGDAGNFFYSNVLSVGSVSFRCQAFHRTQPLGTSTSVRMSWIATGDVA